MEAFHKIVLGIATVLLIFILISVGILLSKDKENKIYPPAALQCPDYWVEDNSGCIVGDLNKGMRYSEGYDELVPFETGRAFDFSTNHSSWFNVDSYAKLSDICAKKQWAIDNKVMWDGISNYNSC